MYSEDQWKNRNSNRKKKISLIASHRPNQCKKGSMNVFERHINIFYSYFFQTVAAIFVLL